MNIFECFGKELFFFRWFMNSIIIYTSTTAFILLRLNVSPLCLSIIGGYMLGLGLVSSKEKIRWKKLLKAAFVKDSLVANAHSRSVSSSLNARLTVPMSLSVPLSFCVYIDYLTDTTTDRSCFYYVGFLDFF